jgi:hypothetical protein
MSDHTWRVGPAELVPNDEIGNYIEPDGAPPWAQDAQGNRRALFQVVVAGDACPTFGALLIEVNEPAPAHERLREMRHPDGDIYREVRGTPLFEKVNDLDAKLSLAREAGLLQGFTNEGRLTMTFTELRAEVVNGYERARGFYERKNAKAKAEVEAARAKVAATRGSEDDREDARWDADQDPAPYDDDLGIARMLQANCLANIQIAQELNEIKHMLADWPPGR